MRKRAWSWARAGSPRTPARLAMPARPAMPAVALSSVLRLNCAVIETFPLFRLGFLSGSHPQRAAGVVEQVAGLRRHGQFYDLVRMDPALPLQLHRQGGAV